MNDELELLKELGREGADPDEASVSRARGLLQGRIERARGRRHRPWRPFHLRFGLAVAIALLLGSGFGFVLGTSSTSSVSAASAPVGLGFLPERGWSVLQTAKEATVDREAIAIAANVPLSPDDAADRLPYSTMLSLPPNGVVILASFTARGDKWRDQHYPVRALPLGLRDAVPGSLQVRPERPLGQYRLQAGVNGHNVDVTVYFGTPRPAPAVIRTAQRQLDRLVVRSRRATDRVEERAFPIRAAASSVTPARETSRIIDRTFRCTLAPLYGGLRDLNVAASPRGSLGNGGASVDVSPGYISLGSGPGTRAFDDFVFARSRLEERVAGAPWAPGVYADARRCAPARVSMPLSARGLPGPPVRFATDADCGIRGRVLVRVRALLEASTSWRRANPPYFGARRDVVQAQIALRSERTRRPIGFLELDAVGKTRLWAASHCN